mgnify:CR=1 FL=1
MEQLQGQERRVVIISTVRSEPSYLEHDAKHRLGFVGNAKRFNVAVTRAQVMLVLAGAVHKNTAVKSMQKEHNVCSHWVVSRLSKTGCLRY